MNSKFCSLSSIRRPVEGRVPPVFLVDDSVADITVASRCYGLSDLENPLVAFFSGEKLLEHIDLAETGQAVMPALVFLDIRMGGIDGLETLKLIRERASCKYTPSIYLLTHEDSPIREETAIENGADGYSNKPTGKQGYIDLFNSFAEVLQNINAGIRSKADADPLLSSE